MNAHLQPLNEAELPSRADDCIVVWVPNELPQQVGVIGSLAAGLRQQGDLPAKAGSLVVQHRPPGWRCKQLLWVGVGAGKPADWRAAVQACAQWVKAETVTALRWVWWVAPQPDAPLAFLKALDELTYTYGHTKPSAPRPPSQQHAVEVPDPAALESAWQQALALVAGVAVAREWGNRPANHATPRHLAEAAQQLAKAHKHIKCKILGPEEVQKLGMGAFLAVAQGSHEPLRFIELRYNGAGKQAQPTVLVGKGITFDSGGISIKPAAEMDEMKFDMCGAASVLGVFAALGVLQPPVHVVGLIPACENLPSGRAVKPGDVVTSLSGQTIEILNTDAEGRLVLCDALTYAARFKPKAVIDIATLTGACVIALGGVRSGLFASDDALAAQLLAAGEAAQDPCWRMPLDDEYAEGLKTPFADVANVAGRPAGAVTAAKFLQRFVGDTPWAHLDIAGTAWKSGSNKGATGRPVGLLLHHLLTHSAAA